MRNQVERIIAEIGQIIQAWPAVDSLVVMENEHAPDDPYFFLSFDVYLSGSLPDAESRQAAFPRAGAFEAKRSGSKDRFLWGDLPVRLEYKPLQRFAHFDPGESTYALHRLMYGRILFSRSAILSQLRTQVCALGAPFWAQCRAEAQSRLEHCLSDLESARIRGDRLFYALSLAGFLRQLCSTLFAINRRLEPNHRLINTELLALPTLPESMKGSLDILLRLGELPLDRHCEIAALLTRKIINL